MQWVAYQEASGRQPVIGLRAQDDTKESVATWLTTLADDKYCTQGNQPWGAPAFQAALCAAFDKTKYVARACAGVPVVTEYQLAFATFKVGLCGALMRVFIVVVTR